MPSTVESEEGSYLRLMEFVSLNSRRDSNKEEEEGVGPGRCPEGSGSVREPPAAPRSLHLPSPANSKLTECLSQLSNDFSQLYQGWLRGRGSACFPWIPTPAITCEHAKRFSHFSKASTRFRVNYTAQSTRLEEADL